MLKNKNYLYITLGVFLVACAIAVIFILINLNQKAPNDTVFTVKQGEGARVISKRLKNENLINSSLVFDTLIYFKKWVLQPGVYEISKGETLTQIAQKMRLGVIDEHLVTIPEGWRVSEIDNLLTEKDIIDKGQFSAISKDKEGYLFPDTYRFSLKVTPEEIRETMLNTFSKRTKDLNFNRDTIILASIVEREAKFDEDRAKIASVYLNRIEKGMRLEADPTIQYAKGSWAPITRADYKNFQSPYNTYLNDGLPPSPICNPGLKSIQAVLNPAKTDYFYFFHKTDGSAVYSKTYDEHLTNLAKFR